MNAEGDATGVTQRAVLLQRASEQIRQERVTFDHRVGQDRQWFRIRLAMGIMALLLIPAFFVTAIIMVWSESLSNEIRLAAAATLLADVLGLIIAMWKIVLAPGTTDRLEPVTLADDVG